MTSPLSICGYLSHLSRIELFACASCYLLVGSSESQPPGAGAEGGGAGGGAGRGAGGGTSAGGGASSAEGGAEGGASGATSPVGTGTSRGEFRLLRILRQPVHSTLQIIPDPTVYSIADMDLLLHSLAPIESLCISFGLVGLIKFLDCYYMTLITRRQKVGQIGGEAIYTVKSTEMIPLRGCVQGEHKRQENNSKGSEDDDRSQGDESVASSHGGTMMASLVGLATKTRELEAATGSGAYHWCLPIVFGAFLQRKVLLSGRETTLILIARRSRHFAGTRYLKRGVSDLGKVANDVEHEQ
ncbi:hypothetical protein TeGR_g621, partial [Tetraparma gracilis]